MYVDHHQLFPLQFDAVWSLDGNLQYDTFLHIYERQVNFIFPEFCIFRQFCFMFLFLKIKSYVIM